MVAGGGAVAVARTADDAGEATSTAGEETPGAAAVGARGHDHDDGAIGGVRGSGHRRHAGGRAGPGEGRGRHTHPTLPAYADREAAATPEERQAADALRAEVTATLEAYADVDDAVAAGYEPPRRPRGRLAHYRDRSTASGGDILDPAHPDGLVYETGGDGDPVLIGAFFVAPRGAAAPAPAGDLVVWHSHDPACAGFFVTPAEPCTESFRMLHVWTADEIELTTRTGATVPVRLVDPYGTPLRASVEPAG